MTIQTNAARLRHFAVHKCWFPARALNHRRAKSMVIGVGMVLALLALPEAFAIEPIANAVKLASSDRYSCAVLSGGTVKCWGANGLGQSGTGIEGNFLVAIDVVGVVDAIAVAAAESHACAATSAGRVWCWGFNGSKELGAIDAPQGPYWSLPVEVAGLGASALAVSAGASHSCALTSTGGVKCWGDGQLGQLGKGSVGYASPPVDVAGISSGAIALASTSNATCVATNAGAVKCWGGNAHGELGDGTTTMRPGPVDVIGLSSGAIGIAAGENHFCAEVSGGAVKCWGGNDYGQLGDNSTVQRSTPVDVIGLPGGVAAVSGGGAHSCALMNGGGVKCWGRNVMGQLGDGASLPGPGPVDVAALSGTVLSLAAGGAHTCALIAGGQIQCWGGNFDGQLGINESYVRTQPVAAAGVSGAAQVRQGASLGCVLTTAGGVKCWGSYTGDGTENYHASAVDVTGLQSGVTKLSVGPSQACAVTLGGGVKCWGQSADGLMGDGLPGRLRLAPVDIAGLTSGVASISVGSSYACAVTTAGGLKCWGSNSLGQLGDGTNVNRALPIDVPGLTSGVAAVAANDFGTCALMTAGGVQCWGGFNAASWTPAAVTGLPNDIVELYSGKCVRTAGGALWCWNSTPSIAAGLSSGVVDAAIGYSHSCAVVAGGQVKCWGSNYFGQLGIGSLTPQSSQTPVAVAGMGDATSISAGGFSTCAVTSSGIVKCWGNGNWNAIGDGIFPGRLAPTAALAFDTTPDALSFTPQSGVPLSTPIVSNAITISGIETGASISVVNGEFSIGCNGVFRVPATTIQNNQTVCVRHTSASALSTSVTTRLIVGTVEAAFTTTTVPFVAQQHGVSVSLEGNGTVESVPPGIACGADCTENYAAGLAVTLIATPQAGSSFAGWSGVNCSGGNGQPVCTFIVKSGLQPKAVFVSGAIANRGRVAAGGQFSMAIRDDGSLYTWGYEVLGMQSLQNFVPTKIEGANDWSEIAASSAAAFAIKTDGTLWSWGAGSTLLVNAGYPYLRIPEKYLAGGGWSRVVAGSYHVFALRNDGTLWAWGKNDSGQLGTTSVPNAPSQVGTSTDWIDVAACNSMSLGVRSDGTLWRWGYNGSGGTIPVPQQLGTEHSWKRVAAGGGHGLALKADGTLWAFGTNSFGEFGSVLPESSAMPMQVGADSDWADIGASSGMSVALKTDGRLFTWGINTYWKLGRGTERTAVATPGQVWTATSMGWTRVSAGEKHVLAYRADGTVWGWGNGDGMVLGTPTSAPSSIPVEPVKSAPSIALAVPASQTSSGQSATFTATLAFSGPLPGAVVFRDEETVIPGCGDVAVVSGSATCITSTLLSGAHRINAIYFDAVNNPAQSPVRIHVVDGIPVAISKTGSGTGKVTSSPAGIDCGTACTALFPPAASVTLTAVPDAGSLFDGWTGPCQYESAVCTITVNDTTPVTAKFALGKSLTVTVPPGTGLVTGQGIFCPSDCTEVFAEGATTTLQQQSGSMIFIGWSGDCSGAGNCALTFDSDKTVTASFGYQLSIGTSGFPGRVTSGAPQSIDCTACNSLVPAGTTMTLTAVPGPQSVFTGWSGACTGTGTCTVSMTGNRSVIASFAHAPSYQVTVSASGTGTGVVTGAGTGLVSPPALSCGAACSAEYYVGSTVTLTAAANSNSTFAGWVNCPSASGNQCTLAAAANVTAIFTLTSMARRNDMKGDGKSDVIWYHSGVGGLIAMDADGLALGPLYMLDQMADLNWKIAGLADLNADGRADIVWRNSATGDVYGLLMNGSTVLQESKFYSEPNLAWRIEQIADLDGDGRADLVWRHQPTGQVYVMRMNGLSFAGGQVIYVEPNLNWKIVASGDMNGDGRADLLWRNDVTGDVFAMIMGTFPAQSGGVIYSEPNTNWKIVGLADFNGDGKADILWQNTATGDVFQMQMNGTTVVAGQVIYSEPSTAWKIVALGDYNGDGKADILWRNTSTGHVYMMLMDGFTVAAANFVYAEPDQNWQIVGP